MESAPEPYGWGAGLLTAKRKAPGGWKPRAQFVRLPVYR